MCLLLLLHLRARCGMVCAPSPCTCRLLVLLWEDCPWQLLRVLMLRLGVGSSAVRVTSMARVLCLRLHLCCRLLVCFPFFQLQQLQLGCRLVLMPLQLGSYRL